MKRHFQIRDGCMLCLSFFRCKLVLSESVVVEWGNALMKGFFIKEGILRVVYP